MNLGRRIAHLEGPLPGGHLSPQAHAIAVDVATTWGLDPDEVVREAERIFAEASAADALGSTEALVAFVALHTGQSPSALFADAQGLGTR
jgi:hypothetical protein